MQLQDPASLGLSGERLARIRPWMNSYVDANKLPGMSVMVARRGQIAFQDWVGRRDVARKLDVEADTVFRIYSMTKPLTSVALMTLFEAARFLLDDPVARYLPALADLRVFSGGTADRYNTVPAERSVSIRDLLTHTSGFTYDFIAETPVGELYQKHGIRHVFGNDRPAEFIRKLGTLPLLAQPGAEWNYSVSTDVLGCLIARLTDQTFDEYLHERVIKPLGMVDTDFQVSDANQARFAVCYTPAGPDGGLALADDSAGSRFLRPPKFPSGGGGLVSTVGDYMRFAQMLLNKGEFGGERVLGRKTVEYLMSNYLGGDMASMGQARFSETSYEGIGFGLGGSVVIDAPRTQVLQSVGTFSWGGMASTAFWVDPSEEIAVVLMTQLQPSSTYPIRNELRTLVNQAVVD